MSTLQILLKLALPLLVVAAVVFIWWAGKAMLEGAREGVQEAKEEASQARTEQETASQQLREARQTGLEELRGRLPWADQHALSLRAVFAEIWIRDLFDQPDDLPHWDYFYGVQPPAEKLGELASTLKDGWDIEGHDSAVSKLGWLLSDGHRADYARIQAALEGEGAFDLADQKRAAQALGLELAREAGVVVRWRAQVGSAGAAAFDYARAVDVAGQALALGYLSESEAWKIIRHCGLHARDTFGSWEAFGHSFQAGAEFWQPAGLINRYRHGRYAKSVAWLLSDPESPWVQVPWTSDFVPGRAVSGQDTPHTPLGLLN